MAKKTKASVKKKPIPGLSAMTGPVGGTVPSANLMGAQPVMGANMVPMSPNLIGANIGRAQQIDAVEQAQMVDTLRKKAAERLAKKKLVGDVSLGPTDVTQNGMTSRAPQSEKKVSVKKKKK